MSKCTSCRGPMASSRGNHKYKESGLSSITLVNVEMLSCAACGEYELVIEDMAGLHRAIAELLALKKGLLTPEEFRFLRKHLGYSQGDFAKKINVTQPTLNRWENGRTRINRAYEIILRQLVCMSERVMSYAPDMVEQVASANETKARKTELVRLQLISENGQTKTHWSAPEPGTLRVG